MKEEELILRDYFKIDDDHSKIRGFVFVHDEDGKIIVKKENMIVKSGRKMIMNAITGSAAFSLDNLDMRAWKSSEGLTTADMGYPNTENSETPSKNIEIIYNEQSSFKYVEVDLNLDSLSPNDTYILGYQSDNMIYAINDYFEKYNYVTLDYSNGYIDESDESKSVHIKFSDIQDNTFCIKMNNGYLGKGSTTSFTLTSGNTADGDNEKQIFTIVGDGLIRLSDNENRYLTFSTKEETFGYYVATAKLTLFKRVANNDKDIIVNGDSTSYTNSSEATNKDYVHIDKSDLYVKFTKTFRSNIDTEVNAITLSLYDDIDKKDVLFSRVVFNPVELSSASKMTVSYYIYF